MTAQEPVGAAAARLHDPIAHSNAHARFWAKVAGGVVGGLVAGALAGMAAVAVIGTGGMATPLVVAGGMTLLTAGGAAGITGIVAGFFGAKAGESLVDEALPETFAVTGMITDASTDVFVNSRATGAARASPDNPLDTVACNKDTGPILIAEGSESVFVNQAVFARKGDAVECGALIHGGSPDVFVGVPKGRVRDVADEVPLVSQILGGILGLAGGVRGLVKCVGKLPSTLKSVWPCLGKFAGGLGIDTVLGIIFNPVHIATGAKILTGEVDTDIDLPGALPLRWVRRYNSLDTRTGAVHGQGWGGDYLVRLHIAANGFVTYTDDQGRDVYWEHVEPGYSQENITEGYTLYCTEDGQYAVGSADGIYRFFESAESMPPPKLAADGSAIPTDANTIHAGLQRLSRLEDDHGNYIALRYHRDFEIKSIIDSTGRLLEFAYLHPAQANGRRLACITLKTGAPGESIGLLARYEYHASGQLARVIDREGETVREFAYNPQHLMVLHRNADGRSCYYEWGEFADHPRVVRHWSNQGDDYRLVHTLNAGVSAVEGGHTVVQDQLGRKYSFDWDADYNIVQSTDALGHVTIQRWNALRQRTALVDPQGRATRYTYDPHGNESTVTDALGRTTRITWLGFRALPMLVKYPDGSSEHFSYDDKFNLIAHTNALGLRTEFGYNELGLPIVSTDAKGGTQRYVWTPRAQLAQFTDCSGRTTHYRYDACGHLQLVTNAAGHTYRYVHALNGQLRSVELPDGAHHHYRYSKTGALLGHTDPYGRQTSFERNARGQLLQRVDAEQRGVRLEYDAAQRLQSLVNENGQAFVFRYDAADRLVEEQRIGGTRVEVTHDASGWPVAVTYHPRTGATAAGGSVEPRHIKLIRDAAGRLIEKRTHHQHYHYRYDDADQLIEASVHAVYYLEAEDLAELQQASLEQIGQQTVTPWQLRPLHTTRFAYDRLGRLSKETVQDHLSGQTHTLEHQHDALGNRTQTILPSLPPGHPQTGYRRALNYLYYGSGHLHQISVSLETEDPGADAGTHRVPAVHQLICDMERDELHEEVWRSQGRLNTRTARDALGRRTGAWSRSGALESTLLAQEANWQQAIEDLQTAQSIEHKELTGLLKTWQYDKAGELLLARHSLHGARSHQYDGTGRIERTQRIHLAGGTGSLPQAANEHFAYDPAGNLQDAGTTQELQRSDRHLQRGYVHDNLVRVFEDKRFFYDGHDRLIEKRSGRHTLQRFEWDEENRLKAVHTTRRPGTEHESTQSTYFRYDALGRRIVKQDEFGTTIFIWEGMRLIEERRGSLVTSYVYEPQSYVPLARLDARGEVTEQGGLGTTADALSEQRSESEQRIAQAVRAFGTERTLRQGVSPPTADDVHVQHRTSVGLPDSHDARRALPRTGTSGQAEPRLCNVYYFHTDQAGMPEELTNADGQLVWQATYKTWGTTVAEEWGVKTLAGQQPVEKGDKPTSEQNLRFQGQYLDRSTGLHYSTFRYYDADIGRFISPDPIGLWGGINLHSYAPNPLSWIDPWGWHCSHRDTITRGPRGEITSVRGTITPADLGTGTGTNASSRANARSMGNNTDDAGHTRGRNLGGGGGVDYTFPQDPNLNRGAFRDFEMEIADYVKSTGRNVDFEQAYHYGSGGTRPTSITYAVYDNGVPILGGARIFENWSVL